MLVNTNAKAQVPTHFYIGQEELANIDIYTILKTKKNELFIGTNQGLFIYGYDKFQSIPRNSNQKGNSFFSLVENKKGEVFCCNLNGQIFQIDQRSCSLYTTIPQEHVGVNSLIALNNSDDLFFSSKGILYVNKGAYEVIYGRTMGHAQNISSTTLKKGFSSVFNNSNDEIVHFNKNGYHIEKMQSFIKEPLRQRYGYPIKLNNQVIGFDRSTFFGINRPIHSEFNELSQLNILGKNEALLSSSKKGLYKVYLDDDTVKIKSKLFPKTFISNVFIDENKNMFLGTFGKGVIIVPHSEMDHYQTENEENAIRSILVKGDNLFYSDLSNGIIRENLETDDYELIDNSNTLKDTKLFYASTGGKHSAKEAYPNLLYALSLSHRFSKVRSGIGIIKDLKQNGNELIIATSRGVVKINSNKNDPEYWSKSGYFFRFKHLNQRCQHVDFVPATKSIYVATSTGLMKLDSTSQIRPIYYKNEKIQCNDIEYHDGQIWVATQEDGILVIDNDSVVRTIGINEGLVPGNIRKIAFTDSLAFLIVNAQLQYIDLHENKVHQFVGREIINGVTDIYLDRQKLFMVINNSQVNSLDIDKLSSNNHELEFALDSILVNDILVSDTALTLTQDENHLRFFFKIQNLEVKNLATINYRLKGIDDAWIKTAGTEFLVEYKSLSPGKYRFEIYASYGINKTPIIVRSFTIKPPFWKSGWFMLSASLCILLSTSLIAHYRIQSIRKRNKTELEKQALKTDLLEAELRTLRSQMNPHFIFNTLNSIQDLVLSQDTDASYDYIVLFAKLVRNTLNYSNKEFIPIQNEVEFLDIYLKLEKLRFGDQLRYNLNSNNLEDEEIKIPSLIVQPFIENALLHGLLHKEGQKELTVSFTLTNNLKCVITDNGIGRENAAQISNRHNSEHTSFAMNAIKKRLEILKVQYGEEIGYTISDLHPDKKNPGTRVEVVIPFQSV
ncbi:MAG: histidine kinase [Flavobacteriales bacterium]